MTVRTMSARPARSPTNLVEITLKGREPGPARLR